MRGSKPRVPKRAAAAVFRLVGVLRVPQERGVRGEDMAASVDGTGGQSSRR
jgi:hypothetical protein